MGTVKGSANTEIAAPIATVYQAAADIEDSPRWQPEIKVAECLERDGDGNQVLVHMEADAKVRRLVSEIRVNYERPSRISWVQENGDVKSVEGSWEFEDLGGERTRVTYHLEVDLGRTLGLLIRGPLVGILRSQMAGAMPERLKRFVEGNAA
jgi:ribosome-associated toxin RatA of RatAB toxin-antitoxin module